MCFFIFKQKDPTSREALFNLALLLSEQYREADAVLFLEELLQVKTFLLSITQIENK